MSVPASAVVWRLDLDPRITLPSQERFDAPIEVAHAIDRRPVRPPVHEVRRRGVASCEHDRHGAFSARKLGGRVRRLQRRAGGERGCDADCQLVRRAERQCSADETVLSRRVAGVDAGEVEALRATAVIEPRLGGRDEAGEGQVVP